MSRRRNYLPRATPQLSAPPRKPGLKLKFLSVRSLVPSAPCRSAVSTGSCCRYRFLQVICPPPQAGFWECKMEMGVFCSVKTSPPPALRVPGLLSRGGGCSLTLCTASHFFGSRQPLHKLPNLEYETDQWCLRIKLTICVRGGVTRAKQAGWQSYGSNRDFCFWIPGGLLSH